MLRKNDGIEGVTSEKEAKEISRKINDILDELSLDDCDESPMEDDGTFGYYNNEEEYFEERIDPMIAEMFSNSDDPQEDADDYAEMMAERAAKD